jgi:[ribosomal protein S5]-alanine N-acetyltransferase
MLYPLRTPRLFLRPANVEDLDALWTLWREREVRRYLFDDEPVTRERASEVLDRCLALVRRGLGLWTLGLRDGPSFIGCAGLTLVTTAAKYEPKLANQIEPTVALSPTMWRHGYAREALRAALGYAFQTLKVESLIATADAPNVASDKMLTSVGFIPTGECDGPRYRLKTYKIGRDRLAKSAVEPL